MKRYLNMIGVEIGRRAADILKGKKKKIRSRDRAHISAILYAIIFIRRARM